MKNLSFASILILLCCLAAFAQANKTSPCPTISITGPPAVPIPNEPIIYVANISNEVDNFNANYKWSAANGEIIEGQGTLIIKVLQNDIIKNLTVTLEVAGLPESCSNIISETMGCGLKVPQALLIEELSSPITQIEKAGDFEKSAALDDNPNAQLHIIFRYKKNTPQKIITRTERKLFNNLIKAGVEKERITLIQGFADTESIQFWLVPTVTTVPEIDQM